MKGTFKARGSLYIPLKIQDFLNNELENIEKNRRLAELLLFQQCLQMNFPKIVKKEIFKIREAFVAT